MQKEKNEMNEKVKTMEINKQSIAKQQQIAKQKEMAIAKLDEDIQIPVKEGFMGRLGNFFTGAPSE